jgi:heme/copper-type cytochrome/quinol oxidase subunit 3
MGGVTAREKLHGVLRFEATLRGTDLASGFVLAEVVFFAVVFWAAAFLDAGDLPLPADVLALLAVMPVFMASAATSLTAAAAMF